MGENPLWKHCSIQHESIEAKFEMKIVGQHRSCIERQANEAVRISRSKADMILNSKSEWHQAPLIRVIPVSGMVEAIGRR